MEINYYYYIKLFVLTKKMCFFSHVWNFTLIYSPYRYLIDVLFGTILLENLFFFKCLLNFRGNALKSEHNKVGYTNFVKFRLQRMTSQIERAFEKTNKPCFCLHFANSSFKTFFYISYPQSLLNLWDEYHFSSIKNWHKSGKKGYLPMKPTGRYYFCLFHSHDPKPKRNHQIASSKAKTKSRQSQTCVEYRGYIICIRRNTGVNTSDLKILHKKC